MRRQRGTLPATICSALLALLAAAALTSGVAARAQTTKACPAVAVLASRGSGDLLGKDQGLGAPGQAFAAQLGQLVPATVPWANRYNAVGVFSWNLRKLAPQLVNGIGAGTKLSGLGLGAYHDSVVGGSEQLQEKLAALARDCSRLSAVVLVGYSQGAQVAADVAQRDLTPTERAMLAAVVLFGDPYFNGGDRTADRGSFSGRRDGFLGRRPAFALGGPTVLSYCHSHDPICQGIYIREGPTRTIDLAALVPPLAQHTNYTSFSEPQEAAIEVARLRRLLDPTTVRLVRPGDSTLPSSLTVAGVRFGVGTRESAAVTLFGPPDTCRVDGGPYNVVASWSGLGVTATTDALGLSNGFVDGCQTPSGTFVGSLKLNGRRWRTAAGLHPSDSLAKLHNLYPHAQPENAKQLGVATAYGVETAPCGFGISGTCSRVVAAIKNGRVEFLELFVGGQGE